MPEYVCQLGERISVRQLTAKTIFNDCNNNTSTKYNIVE